MGIAFTNISIGPGFAYFPGLSLAFKEIAYCNFGTRPFTYPVEGYQPLQVSLLLLLLAGITLYENLCVCVCSRFGDLPV